MKTRDDMKFITLFFIINFLFFKVLNANLNASFDCSKARSTMELLICSDKKLANEDIDLLQTYRNVKQYLTSQEKKELLNTQREWLKERQKICGVPQKYLQKDDNNDVIECLISQYQKRIEEIKLFNRNLPTKKEIPTKEKPTKKIDKRINNLTKEVKFDGYYSLFDSVKLPNGETKYLESYIKIKKEHDLEYTVEGVVYMPNGNSCDIIAIKMMLEDSKLIYSNEKCKFIIKKENNELILEDKNHQCSLNIFDCGLNTSVDSMKFDIY